MIAQHLLTDDAPVYVAVKRALRERIGSRWRVNDRLPPVAELARELGVGQNSAHRAVRELVAEGVLLTRRRLGTFVRRLPAEIRDTGTLARSLQGVTLAMAFHGANPPPFIQRMVAGFCEVVQEAGADTVPLPMEMSVKALPPLGGAWGVAAFNLGSYVQVPPGLHKLVSVAAGEHPHWSTSRFDAVSVDQFQGGALAGVALRDLGCRSLCFVGHRVGINRHRFDITSAARLHGLEMGWGELLHEDHLLYAPGYSMMAGARRFQQYLALNPRPDGVFCASDDLAMGFMAAAVSHGLTPGVDFQLIGFDGQDVDSPASPGTKLTTVRIPAAMMGRRAAELMIQRAADPTLPIQRLLMSCSFSQGDTTRRT